MAHQLTSAREESIANRQTREVKLTAEECPALALHRIAHIGWVETPPPYRVVRLQPTGSFVMACVAGEGRVLLDGRWQQFRPGTACLAPPRTLNAFHAVPGKRLHFCWVRYFEPAGTPPVVSAQSPVKAPCDPTLLYSAAQGLRAEAAGAGEARLLHHWVELIHAEVERLAKPWHLRERLARIWFRVAEDLAAPWSAEELARRAHCSKEHLRRLCLRELGRTPMQQVTFMRVQRATELLCETEEKLESIALAVGYSNAFALSKVLKKWLGCSPTEYRAQRLR